MTDIWDEKPEMDRIVYDCPDADGFHSSGAYEVYHKEDMDAWLEKVKAYYTDLESMKKALIELGLCNTKYGKISLIGVNEINELKEKAEKWDKLMDHPHFADMPIENILAESEFLTTRRNEMGLALEQIRAEVKGKCDLCLKLVTDCEDCDYGMIKNILENVYPQEETET